jgi:hypothetical protein
VNPPPAVKPPGSRLELVAAVTPGETGDVRNYGQFCPIARGSEILAERWTPIILRNILQGCRTFNEIAAGRGCQGRCSPAACASWNGPG